jgi:hypothetical protein
LLSRFRCAWIGTVGLVILALATLGGCVQQPTELDPIGQWEHSQGTTKSVASLEVGGDISFLNTPREVLDPTADHLVDIAPTDLVDVDGKWSLGESDGSGRLVLTISIPASDDFAGGTFPVFVRRAGADDELVRYLSNDDDVEFVFQRAH